MSIALVPTCLQEFEKEAGYMVERIGIPRFASEDEERQFWATHDSIDFADGAEEVILEYGETPNRTGSISRESFYEN